MHLTTKEKTFKNDKFYESTLKLLSDIDFLWQCWCRRNMQEFQSKSVDFLVNVTLRNSKTSENKYFKLWNVFFIYTDKSLIGFDLTKVFLRPQWQYCVQSDKPLLLFKRVHDVIVAANGGSEIRFVKYALRGRRFYRVNWFADLTTNLKTETMSKKRQEGNQMQWTLQVCMFARGFLKRSLQSFSPIKVQTSARLLWTTQMHNEVPHK